MNTTINHQAKAAKKLALMKESIRLLTTAQATDAQFTPTRDGCAA